MTELPIGYDTSQSLFDSCFRVDMKHEFKRKYESNSRRLGVFTRGR